MNESEKNFTVGQKVWFRDTLGELRSGNVVYCNKKLVITNNESSTIPIQNVYATKQLANYAIQQKNQEDLEKYKAEIQTEKDLIFFALKYDLYGEDNIMIQKAFLEKAEEFYPGIIQEYRDKIGMIYDLDL